MSTSMNPLACRLDAIGPADRPRYHELVKRVRSAIAGRTEVPDGYEYTLAAKVISQRELVEWVGSSGYAALF